MASFCSGCGFPQASMAAFCPNCGARQPGAPTAAPAQPQPVAVAAAPVAKSSAGVKIVVGLLVFFMVAGIAAIGGIYYLAHRVKQAVVEKANAAGIELPGATVTHASATPRKIPKPCEVLSNSEVSALLGEPIERSLVQEESCNYYGPAGMTTKLAQEHANSTFQKLKAPGGQQPGGQELMGALEQLSNSIAAQQANDAGKGDAPFLMLMLDPDGKAQMTALSISKSLFNGITNSKETGIQMGQEIPGLGDRAIWLRKLGLNVLKGGLLIRVIAGPVPDPDAKSIEVARAVLKKLD